MNFTDSRFLVFVLIVYALWWLAGRHYRAKIALLLVSSLLFYCYHTWQILFLLLAYCLVDWAVGCWIARSRRPRLVLALGVTFNLTVLAYWKYTPLLLRTAARLLLALDLPTPTTPDSFRSPSGERRTSSARAPARSP